MKNLELEVNVEGAEDLLRPLIEVMQSLKDLPEFPFDVFYSLITDGLDDLSVSLDRSALSTGNFGVVVRPGRRLELITAALLALNAYLHR